MKTKIYIIYLLTLLLFCPFYIEAQDNQFVKEKNRISRWIDSGKRFFKKREKKDEIHINLHELTLEENIKIPVPASSAVNNLKTALSFEPDKAYSIIYASKRRSYKGCYSDGPAFPTQ